jgi:predicted PurR-regulated permease PerM
MLLASTVTVGWLLYLLSPILTPFFLAALFAYLGDPVVDWLEGKGRSRSVAVVLVFLLMTLLMILLLLLVVPLLQKQFVLLARATPGYINWAALHILPWIERNTGISTEQLEFSALSQWVKEHWSQAGGFAAYVIGYVTKSGGLLAGWLTNVFLVPVVTFYLLRDWDNLVTSINHLLPRDIEPEISKVTREADEMLGAFLRGQMLVMVILGAVYSMGLWLVGLKFSLLIGMLAGLVSFVPYLGFIVGILVAGMAVIFQTHEPMQLIPVVAVFAVGQAFEGMVLTPMLVGDKIGIHPVAIIFAILAGGQLFGFVGVLLALPVAAVLAVIVRHLHRRYLDSNMYLASTPGNQDPG